MLTKYKMCTRFSMLLHKFNTTKCLAFSSHRKFCLNTVMTNYGIKSKNITRQFHNVSNPLEEMMNTVPPESEALSPNDTLNIFRRLSETSQTLSSSSAPSFNIIEHEKFEILRRATKVSMLYLKSIDKFDILKAIETLSVPVDDEVYDTVLSSLLDNVYNMSLDDIMIIDTFLVSKQSNPLARELHRNLIDRFNTKTSQLPIEFNYFNKMRRMLMFIQRNRYQIIDEVFVNIEDYAKKNQIDIFTAKEAMDIIITLSNFNDKCEYFRPILEKAFNIWSTNEVSVEMVHDVLRLLNKRISTMNYGLYKATRFIEKCARVTIESGDLKECFAIQKLLNRLEFSSKQLIDFLLENVKSETIKDNFLLNSISICIACDIANHRPPLFTDFLLPALATMNFHQQLDIKLDWPKFALRLNNFGIYHEPLIQEILKRRQQFELLDGSSIQELEILQMEKLVNASVYNLLSDLRTNFGEYIRLLMRIDNDAIIPLLLKIDFHSKQLVPFEELETNSLCAVKCDENQCLVAVVTSCTASVEITQPGLITIPLNASEWMKLLMNKTIDELFAKISDHIQCQKKEATNLF